MGPLLFGNGIGNKIPIINIQSSCQQILAMKENNLYQKTPYINSLQRAKILNFTTCSKFKTKFNLFSLKIVHHNNKLTKEAQSQFIWTNPIHLSHSLIESKWILYPTYVKKELQIFIKLLVSSLNVL
jgi:hypothetical protein